MAEQSEVAVLILEDDQLYAQSLADSLRSFDVELTSATTVSPVQAMRLVDELHPKLLIADLHLGSYNFLTLLNELISYPDTIALPKVILSSSAQRLNQADMADYGVVAIYDKATYDFTDLAELARGIVRGG